MPLTMVIVELGLGFRAFCNQEYEANLEAGRVRIQGCMVDVPQVGDMGRP